MKTNVQFIKSYKQKSNAFDRKSVKLNQLKDGNYISGNAPIIHPNTHPRKRGEQETGLYLDLQLTIFFSNLV